MASGTDKAAGARVAEARAGRVNVGGKDRAFTELSADEARLQAVELKEAGTWGPMQRVAKVSLSWGELARAMDEAEVATVGELSDEAVLTFAERVWIVPPEQGLIWSEAAEPAAEGAKGMADEHEHAEGEAHSHEHAHGDETHSHAHDEHDHEHTEHEHEHSHGDVTHSHPHSHQEGLEDDHSHEHE